MDRRRKNLGDWGEDLACDFLCRRGFEIVERNFHTTVGELDIVAKKGGDYYFVEVKTRAEAEMANDLAANGLKRYRAEKAMNIYRYRRDLPDVSMIPALVVIFLDRVKKTARIRFVLLTDW